MEGAATLLTVALGAVLYFLARAVSRRRASKGAGAVAFVEPVKTTAGERTIYEISDALAPAYQTIARPDDLVDNPDFRDGVALLSSDRFTARDLADYFCGDNAVIALLAVRALRNRPDGLEARDQVTASIGTVAPWPLHFAAEYLAHSVAAGDPIIGQLLARCLDYLYNRQVRISLAEFIRERLRRGEVPEFGDELAGFPNESLRPLWDFLNGLDAEIGEPVKAALQAWSDRHVDRTFLESFGSVWDGDRLGEARQIVEHPALASAVTLAVDTLCASPARSILLVGEPGVGKMTLATKVAERLGAEGWTIFSAGHSQLIAGQSYIGQMEERLRQLLVQLGGRRRILWIVPDFHNLAFSGRHQYGPVSVLDTVLGPIQRGDIKVLGITTPKSYEMLVRQKPGVETAMAIAKVDAMKAGETRALALDWLARQTGRREEGEALVQEAWELAQQYLTAQAAPGNIFDLLRLAMHGARTDPDRQDPMITVDDLVETLADITGLPLGLLDDRRRIDIEGLRRTFNARVLGQPEAVDCLVERVAMMKAGLADPHRPVGVFLFAGPTGTGKTEMAKTLATWLFGSDQRMIRLDMSEFQSPEDLERIFGDSGGAAADTLIGRIREQPFSVILLDEFEKAHQRVWDLFLQVFDDGRLTDRAGYTADFRHSIIILTSNLGSTVPTGVSLGFRSTDEGFDPGAVMRAVEQAFRREFVNRLDRVVVFRPLTRELMRGILEKELADVLQRRGLRSKPWAVEWDAAAIDFLLDKGFTRDLGARPLRRAVERHLLSPLAITIVNHEAPDGDQFLFVSRKEGRLDVRFVDPDAPEEEGDAPAPPQATDSSLTLQSVMLEPAGSAPEMNLLRDRYEALGAKIDGTDWRSAEAADVTAMGAADFWNSERRARVLDRIERRSRIAYALKRAGSLLGRLDRSASEKRDRYPSDLVASLAGSLYLVSIAIEDVLTERPSDAFLEVTVSHIREADLAATEVFAREVAEMYGAWARARRMKVDTIDDGQAGGFRFRAVVRGFGAYTILAPEHGLHVLECPSEGAKSGERLVVAVKVAPEAPELGLLAGQALAREAEKALGRGDGGPKIVRRYRKAPSPLVRDGVRGWRTGRIDQVLGGDFDLVA